MRLRWAHTAGAACRNAVRRYSAQAELDVRNAGELPACARGGAELARMHSQACYGRLGSFCGGQTRASASTVGLERRRPRPRHGVPADSAKKLAFGVCNTDTQVAGPQQLAPAHNSRRYPGCRSTVVKPEVAFGQSGCRTTDAVSHRDDRRPVFGICDHAGLKSGVPQAYHVGMCCALTSSGMSDSCPL